MSWAGMVVPLGTRRRPLVWRPCPRVVHLPVMSQSGSRRCGGCGPWMSVCPAGRSRCPLGNGVSAAAGGGRPAAGVSVMMMALPSSMGVGCGSPRLVAGCASVGGCSRSSSPSARTISLASSASKVCCRCWSSRCCWWMCSCVAWAFRCHSASSDCFASSSALVVMMRWSSAVRRAA